MNEKAQNISTDPEHQPDWRQIIEESAYSLNGVCRKYGFTRKTLLKWLDGTQKPRKSSLEKVVKTMAELRDTPARQRHPSFGYASKKQIEKLNGMGISPQRDALLAQIEQQNKLQGKIA